MSRYQEDEFELGSRWRKEPVFSSSPLWFKLGIAFMVVLGIIGAVIVY